MKITIIGTGYVGLVTGACLAEMGNDVLCLDVDPAKVRLLNEGGIPIHEAGLAPMVRRNIDAGRLAFSTDPDRAVQHGTLQVIAVGTPPEEDGSADLRHVLEAARSIGARMTDYKVVVNKSTVPVGTADQVRSVVAAELKRRNSAIPFAVVSNPEFLKEGNAVADFMRPDRVILGADDDRAIGIMRQLYAPYLRNHDRIMVMDVRSAELTKYAANAMLATRISFMNELANLAEDVGADIESVRLGIGADARIGYSFLYAGCGYGGSCFPKDIKALIQTGRQYGHLMPLLAAVEATNTGQKAVLLAKITQHFGEDLAGRTFALWGLSFKPNTDDLREAPSRTVIAGLLERGASVVAYDPVAMEEAGRLFTDEPRLRFAGQALDACRDADALIIVTEWKEFRSPDFDEIASVLKQPVIFDGRNLYEPGPLRERGFRYFAIGR